MVTRPGGFTVHKFYPAGYVSLTRAENAIFEVEKREEKARGGRNEIHSTLTAHTPPRTFLERELKIEDSKSED